MKPLDPQQPVSPAELAAIVASHDRLQQWNTLVEAALTASSDRPAPGLLSNIRETARLIIESGRHVSAQNFELMRAMNIHDRTLSIPEVMEGVGQGALDYIREKFPQPVASGDMSLAHSKAHVAALESSLKQGYSALSHAAAMAMDHPAQFAAAVAEIPEKVASDYQQSITHLQTGMAQAVNSQDPSRSLGLVLGAGMTQVVGETFDPFKKLEKGADAANDLAQAEQRLDQVPDMAASMRWEDFAKLGAGTVPGGGRINRDFSEKFRFYPLPREVYYREGPNFFQSGVSLDGEHSILIISQDGPGYGYGDELHKAALKVYHNHGIEITAHDGNWPKKPNYTNWRQYDAGLAAGLTPQQAALNTFSGKMARESGLTRATVVENTPYRIHVDFQRPDWGNDAAWNDYANHWVSSMGNRADHSLHQQPPRPEELFPIPKAEGAAATEPPPPASHDVHGRVGQAVNNVAEASDPVADPVENMLIGHIAASDLSPEAKTMAIARVRDNFASTEMTPQDPEIT